MNTLFDGSDVGPNPPAPPANDNPAPSSRHAGTVSLEDANARRDDVATARGSQSLSHTVVDSLDEPLPLRHEEIMIAGPLIEAVLERLKAVAANDNNGKSR